MDNGMRKLELGKCHRLVLGELRIVRNPGLCGGRNGSNSVADKLGSNLGHGAANRSVAGMVEMEPLPKTLSACPLLENGDECTASLAESILRFMQLDVIFDRRLETHGGRADRLCQSDDFTGVL